ncbi:hypothetical protein [Brenneria goodwinii]|uniref:hypothetical protein n=1 Tax=Brenneria goodwinii TaxID=1109412 RepID=UPI00027AFFE1|nr:Hypothetical protein Y17_4172 [Pectobacterium wasabiae CFBP 3304]
MLNKIAIYFIVVSTLILCSCEQNDNNCSSLDNKGGSYKYDNCALHNNNTPSPKKEW